MIHWSTPTSIALLSAAVFWNFDSVTALLTNLACLSYYASGHHAATSAAWKEKK